jgi:hypothetical protein
MLPPRAFKGSAKLTARRNQCLINSSQPVQSSIHRRRRLCHPSSAGHYTTGPNTPRAHHAPQSTSSPDLLLDGCRLIISTPHAPHCRSCSPVDSERLDAPLPDKAAPKQAEASETRPAGADARPQAVSAADGSSMKPASPQEPCAGGRQGVQPGGSTNQPALTSAPTPTPARPSLPAATPSTAFEAGPREACQPVRPSEHEASATGADGTGPRVAQQEAPLPALGSGCQVGKGRQTFPPSTDAPLNPCTPCMQPAPAYAVLSSKRS